MIEVTDLKAIRFESSDLADLRMLLRQLIGQPFRFFRISYGDELRLHLGSLIEYSTPRMKGRTRGSYVLGARASAWVVSSVPRSVLLTSDGVRVQEPRGNSKRVDIRQIEQGDYITPGSIVVGVTSDLESPGFVLHLRFDDGSIVVIGPNSEEQEGDSSRESEAQGEDFGADMEISDWEILTPYSRILRVGPGNRWCYLDSNKRK